jgi:hypothetical protein
MAGSRVGLFDNFNIPIHRDAQHREDLFALARVPVRASRRWSAVSFRGLSVMYP